MVRQFNPKKIPSPRGIPPWHLPDSYRDKPVDLEIGCGVGWHAIRYAQIHPERFHIAIEKTREKYEKFRKRLLHHAELPNLWPLHADARAWVTHCLGSQKLSRCFLFYPNPNPKSSSQRWIRMPFMHQLLGSLKLGGELRLLTNESFYAEEFKHYARHEWKLKLSYEKVFNQMTEPNPRTHFEKKYLLRGDTCFELHAVKMGN